MQARSLKQEIPSLYCLKALLAFMVVLIHSQGYGRDELMFILRASVPCFYVISGYFFYSGDAEKEIHRAWRVVWKTLKLLFFLTIIYSLYPLAFTAEKFVFYLLFGMPNETSSPLWYLASLWQAFAFIAIVRRYCQHMWIMMIIAFVSQIFYTIYLLPLATDNATFIAYSQPFYAVVYIGAGYLVAQYHLSSKLSTHLLCVLLGLLLMSAFSLQYGFLPLFQAQGGNSRYLACLTLIYSGIAASVLALCVKFRKCNISCLSWIGKYHSANIYFYHFVVLLQLHRLEYHFPALNVISTSFSAYIVYMICLPLSMAVNKIWKLIQGLPHRLLSGARK